MLVSIVTSSILNLALPLADFSFAQQRLPTVPPCSAHQFVTIATLLILLLRLIPPILTSCSQNFYLLAMPIPPNQLRMYIPQFIATSPTLAATYKLFKR